MNKKESLDWARARGQEGKLAGYRGIHPVEFNTIEENGKVSRTRIEGRLNNADREQETEFVLSHKKSAKELVGGISAEEFLAQKADYKNTEKVHQENIKNLQKEIAELEEQVYAEELSKIPTEGKILRARLEMNHKPENREKASTILGRIKLNVLRGYQKLVRTLHYVPYVKNVLEMQKINERILDLNAEIQRNKNVRIPNEKKARYWHRREGIPPDHVQNPAERKN